MEKLESKAQAGDKSSTKHKTPPKWISEAMWQQCQHLEATLPVMDKLCRSIMSNRNQWDKFYTSDNTYKLMAKVFTNPEGIIISSFFFFLYYFIYPSICQSNYLSISL